MKGRWKNESALNSKRMVSLHCLHSQKKKVEDAIYQSRFFSFLGEIILVELFAQNIFSLLKSSCKNYEWYREPQTGGATE